LAALHFLAASVKWIVRSTLPVESGGHVRDLPDAGKTTPAGCTIDGILELEEGKLRSGQHCTIERKSASKPSSALNQVNNQDDDRNYEQEMDQAAANVADEAKKPEHHQDDNYSPEHGIPLG
jgi:hypothetical protein